MIKQFKLFEGRYDRITGIAVDELWKMIKMTKVLHDINDPRIKYDEDGFLEREIDYEFNDRVEFDLFLRIKREHVKFKHGFYIDGSSYEDEDIIITLIIDPDKEPACYSVLNSWLQETVRHEIEHLTHVGINRIDDRPYRENSIKLRRKLIDEHSKGENENSYMYYLLEDEIGPLVQGMYRKSKTDRKPLIDIFNEFLDTMIEEDIIKSDKRKLIFDTWCKEAKRLFPNFKINEAIRWWTSGALLPPEDEDIESDLENLNVGDSVILDGKIFILRTINGNYRSNININNIEYAYWEELFKRNEKMEITQIDYGENVEGYTGQVIRLKDRWPWYQTTNIKKL